MTLMLLRQLSLRPLSQTFSGIRIQSKTYALRPRIHAMPLITINQSVMEALKKHDVIPDVINEFHPSTFLQAKFKSDAEVQLGNTIKKDDCQDIPIVELTPESDPADDKHTYTLCMTDPDAPSRPEPKNSEFCHWLITGIKPTAGKVDLHHTKELIEWMGPAPPEKTGKHRYVLLLFKNGEKELEKPSDRKKWGNMDHEGRIGANAYAHKYGLTLVGANFFFVQNEKQ